MYDPIAFNPDQPNKNFKNGITAQTPPTGTTPIGFTRFDYENSVEGYELAGAEITANPLTVTEQNLKEGHALYVTYCAVCHGPEGNGDGTITKDREVEDSRGKRALENFPEPPSYQKSAGTPSSRGGQMSFTRSPTDGTLWGHTHHKSHQKIGGKLLCMCKNYKRNN
jgi:hypothetical protein